MKLKYAAFTVALMSAAPAFAQNQMDANPSPAFRPGSAPSGGRIGAVCNNSVLPRVDQVTCTKMMKNAKTPEERAGVRELVSERVRVLQKEMDIFADRRGRNNGGNIQVR